MCIAYLRSKIRLSSDTFDSSRLIDCWRGGACGARLGASLIWRLEFNHHLEFGKLCRECIDSIQARRQSQFSYEIIAIDNASYDDCANLLKRRFPFVASYRMNAISASLGLTTLEPPTRVGIPFYSSILTQKSKATL